MTARHVLYGKNLIESVPLENQRKSNTFSLLLAETMPTLIRIFEPNDRNFNTVMEPYQTQVFDEVLTLHPGTITEITLD